MRRVQGRFAKKKKTARGRESGKKEAPSVLRISQETLGGLLF